MAPQGRIVGGLEDLAGKMRSPASRCKGRALAAIGECAAAQLAGLTHRSFTTAEASSAPGARGGLNREIIKGLSPALIGPG
jgi:hypothetical protein